MNDMTDKRTVARELKGLMAYFAVILLVFVVFSLFLNARVLPVFDEIARKIDVPAGYVPWRTYQVSLVIRSYWVWYTAGAGIVAAILVVLGALSRFGGRFALPRRIQRLVSQIGLRLPLLGRLVKSANIATSTQMFAQLVEAGVPLDAALDELAEASINPSFASTFRRMRDKIRQGAPLSQAAESETRLLPKSFAVAAANAEYHGDLPGALRNLAVFYRARAFRQMKMVKPVLMPVLIFILGGLVFTQYAGTFVAVINMGEVIMGGM